MNFDVTEANRRISNTIQLGVIDSVDYATGKARVKIGEILTSELPMVTTRAGQDRAWWPYEPGEQVCVFAPSGNLSAGVIMGALFGGAAGANGNSAGVHRQTYADGSVIEYDRNANHFRMNLGSGTAEIVAPGGISIVGTVTVVGDVVADGVSLKSHRHGGIVKGASDTEGPK